MTTPNLTLRNTVREGRAALRLTREEFARRAGTSTSTLTRLELYGAVPRVQALHGIASVLGISLDDLLRTQEASA